MNASTYDGAHQGADTVHTGAMTMEPDTAAERPEGPGEQPATGAAGVTSTEAATDAHTEETTVAARGGERWYTGLGEMFSTLFWDIGLSIAVYYVLRACGVGVYPSMLGATAAAALRVVYVAVLPRRFDVFAAFMLSVWGVGLLLSFVSGDARFVLAKDSVPTGLAGLIFLGTAVAGRPMIYAVVRRTQGRTPRALAELERRWAAEPAFRRTLTVMTCVWGVGMTAEAVLRLPMIYLLPVDAATGLSGLMQLATFGLLTVYTVVHRKWATRHLRR
ncbi:VC0807 family protein [Streptomyces sp. Ru73]|uniref:VC0807 family protein n=1 Tax=Streptomyces sp. Ru73 TaxID=2080748 RepID=UPI0011B0D60A|nr:VC0807 family protein [Streptomyces sp. Ru73]